MATRGFEFVGMVDGSNATPVIRDFKLGVAAAHHIGDLVLIQADDGAVDQTGSGTLAAVTGVIQEEVAAASITPGTTMAKVAIITGMQIWRCSCDGVASGIYQGVATLDTANCRSVDIDDVSGGTMIVYDVDGLDDDGNTLAYVLFANSTFDPA